MNIDIT